MYIFLKRLFDIFSSFFGLLVFFPLFLLVAVLIKIDSKGPIFYRGLRAGKGGKPFRIFKFRTMVQNAEHMGASSTADDDPRITSVGRIIRRYKFDEAPQLINILIGEMSFVGPRPQVLWALERYSEDHKIILTAYPGIADYAFVVLPNEGEILQGSKNPDQDYFDKLHPLKMKYSLDYIRKRSFWFDIKILIDTALLSFFNRALFFRNQRIKELEEIEA